MLRIYGRITSSKITQELNPWSKTASSDGRSTASRSPPSVNADLTNLNPKAMLLHLELTVEARVARFLTRHLPPPLRVLRPKPRNILLNESPPGVGGVQAGILHRNPLHVHQHLQPMWSSDGMAATNIPRRRMNIFCVTSNSGCNKIQIRRRLIFVRGSTRKYVTIGIL